MNARAVIRAAIAEKRLPTNSPNQTFTQFVRLVESDVNFTVRRLAEQLNVTRQTVYQWLRKINAGKSVTVRGRTRKFRQGRSTPLSIRIPASLIEDLALANPGLALEHITAAIRLTAENAVAKQYGVELATGPATAASIPVRVN